MTTNRSIRSAALVALVALLPAALAAQVRPALHDGSAKSGAPVALLRADGTAPHAVSGTVAHIEGTRFDVRTRAGRDVHVDAAVAEKSGRMSAPLFAGKVVLAEGNYDAAHTLYAARVTRMSRLDATTPPDR